MTDDQVGEAVDQMRSHCQFLVEKADYSGVAARSALYLLGYHGEDADQVIEAIAEEGFTYCLDPQVKSYSGVEDEHFYPNEDACYWMPDQLKSRLDSCTRLGKGHMRTQHYEG
jgi:hypothetical protein